jgi:hypothetical protein
MRRFLASVLGTFLGANALWMLAMPMHWYARFPGVTETGPANAHFIRDIGCAYLAAALALLWFAVAPKRSWPAVLAGGGFLFLHAFIHVWDTMAGREHSHRLLAEIPTVLLPALLTLWIGWPSNSASGEDL